MIALRAVGHVYSNGTPWARRALTGIDLEVRERERVLVIGANGSGKSTLAWILAGLIAPSEGRATVDGADLFAARGAAAISFQHARLQLFRPTVAEDVAFGTRAAGHEVDAALSMVGLDASSFRGRRIDELSGGEQRRVAIAGQLMRRPRLLVLDEPFSGLDAPARRMLLDVLDALPARTGTATVVVSHDHDIEDVADRVLELDGGRVVSDQAAG